VPPDLVDPIAQYDHDDGSAVIGGYVYRGIQIPGLAERFVFGDWGTFGSPSGRLYYLDAASAVKELRIGMQDRSLGYYLKGYGEDASGELYVFASKALGPAGGSGVMYKLVPPPAAALGQISGAVTDGTNFLTTWSGGIGPFAQQRKASLSEPVWMNETVSTTNQAVRPMFSPSGFFRELDTAGQPTVPFTALLNGANERPDPTTTSGEGFGIFSLEGNSLTFTITYSGLSGPALAAHIHGPAPATNPAPVLIDLEPFHTGPFSTNGSFSGTIVLSDDNKALVMQGRTYANVHTQANPDGEIRGQIAPVLMEASLLGAYEPSNVITPASGLASLTLVGDQLTFNIAYRGLSGPANAAHFHASAQLGMNAPVEIGLSSFKGGPFGTSGYVTGTTNLTAFQLAAFIDGQAYVNFHTATNPGGEIRGQVLGKSTAVPLTAFVSGLNEHPALTNSATGYGIFSVEGDQLAFTVHYSGLSAPAGAAHLHGPAITASNAPVLIDLAPYHVGPFDTSGVFAGSLTLSSAEKEMILDGMTYFNVHTTNNPGGEARGQVTPVLMSAAASGSAERPNPIVTAGSALGLFTLTGNQLNLNIVYRGLSGTALDAHIHAPADTGSSADVALGLGPFNGGSWGASGSLTGSTTLDPTLPLLGYIIDGLSYMNFHTATNPPGEIRGQIEH
jgi:hypothetical protein